MSNQVFCGLPIYECGQLVIEEAKRYGKRVEGRDGDCLVVAYFWQGNVYVTEVVYGDQ